MCAFNTLPFLLFIGKPSWYWIRQNNSKRNIYLQLFVLFLFFFFLSLCKSTAKILLGCCKEGRGYLKFSISLEYCFLSTKTMNTKFNIYVRHDFDKQKKTDFQKGICITETHIMSFYDLKLELKLSSNLYDQLHTFSFS